MLQKIASLENWHRYLLAFLVALDAVCVAVSTGAVKVPEDLKDLAPWAALANVFLVAFLPRFQLPTGPGAPPILSPPPKDAPSGLNIVQGPSASVNASQPMILVDGHALPIETPPKGLP